MTALECLLAVLGFKNLKLEAFQDSPRHLADDAGVIDNQTRLHIVLTLSARSGRCERAFLHLSVPRRGDQPRTAEINHPIGIKRDKNIFVEPESGCCSV